MSLTEAVNGILGVLTMAGQIVSVVLIICLVSGRGKECVHFFGKQTLTLAFIVALTAMLGSLTYSNVIGYEPCELCWFQRIFMYPQVFLFALALWKKDRRVIDYSLILSTIGGLIALYHYLMQLDIAPSLPCAAIGYSVSCSQRFVMQFGYITIPLMAFTAFVMIILFVVSAKRADFDNR